MQRRDLAQRPARDILEDFLRSPGRRVRIQNKARSPLNRGPRRDIRIREIDYAAGSVTVISSDCSSCVLARIFPLCTAVMAEAMESPSP